MLSSCIRFVAILVFLGSPPVWAQEESVLEEIIVTAQKREQSLREVPISISLVTGQKIIEQGFNNLEDVLTFVPGAIIEQGQRGYDGNATMRGISQNALNTSFEQSVAVFNDGVYYGRPSQSVAGLYDLERAEVLFGPQPVYFGQSAIAGLISYTSARPETGQFEGYAIGEAGNLGHLKFEGAVNIPLGDRWAARVAGKYQEEDGWTENSVTGGDASARENSAFRIAVAGDVSDRLSAYAKFESFEQESDGTNTDAIECNPAAAQVPPLALCVAAQMQGLATYEYDDVIPRGGFSSAHLLPQAMAPVGNLDLTQLPVAQLDALGGDIEGSNALLELEYELNDNIAISSLTAFAEYDTLATEDFDGTPFASLQFPNTESYEQFSQELRIQSTGNQLEWMAGLYWQDQELEFSTDIISALPNPMGPSGTNATEYGEDAEYLAGFAAITYNFNDSWSIDLGARYQEVDKDAYLWEIDSFLTDANGNRITQTGPPSPNGTPLTVVPNGTQAFGYSGPLGQMAAGDRCLGNTPNGDDCAAIFANGSPAQRAYLASIGGDTSLDRTDDDLTIDAALRWNANDSASYFIRYVEGFKGGGFSRASSSFIVRTKGAYEPETAKSVELGGRLSLLDNRFRWNFTFYKTAYDDQQVSAQFVDPATGVSFFIFTNASESTIQGLETDLSFNAENGFFVNAALAINDSEYDSFPAAQCIFSEIVSGECGPTGTLDLSGTEFDGLPDWSASVGVGYDNAISDRLGIRLSVDGSIYDDWDNTRPTGQTFQDQRSQDSFSIWNLRAALYSLDGRWEVAAYGRNITDELYWLRQPNGIGVFGFDIANVSRPATYGVTLRYNFGAR